MPLSDRTIALISVVSVIAFASIIALTIYFHRRRLRRSPGQSSTEDPNRSPSWPSSSTPSIKLEHRRQTHSDRKVFSWFNKVDPDADERGIFRMSISDRRSLWVPTEREVADLEAAMERVRGRESVASTRMPGGLERALVRESTVS